MYDNDNDSLVYREKIITAWYVYSKGALSCKI